MTEPTDQAPPPGDKADDDDVDLFIKLNQVVLALMQVRTKFPEVSSAAMWVALAVIRTFIEQDMEAHNKKMGDEYDLEEAKAHYERTAQWFIKASFAITDKIAPGFQDMTAEQRNHVLTLLGLNRANLPRG